MKVRTLEKKKLWKSEKRKIKRVYQYNINKFWLKDNSSQVKLSSFKRYLYIISMPQITQVVKYNVFFKTRHNSIVEHIITKKF